MFKCMRNPVMNAFTAARLINDLFKIKAAWIAERKVGANED